jgi:hypothetical protein
MYNKTFMPVSKDYKLADMEGSFKPPKKPVYNRPDQCIEVLTAMQNIIARKKLQLIGKPLSQENLAALIRAMREVTGCEPEIGRGLLQPFLNCLITKRIQDLICWQVAGNRKLAKERTVLLYSGKPEELGWMSCAIAEHLEDPTNILGCYRLKVLDGPAAGFDMYMKVPKSFSRMSYAVGACYKVDKQRIKLADPRQAVQMQMLVYPDSIPLLQFEPHVGHTTARLNIKDNSVGLLRATPKQKKFNLKLMQDRKKNCIRFLTTDCSKCWVGYDSCPRGTQPNTEVQLPASVSITIQGKNLCPKTISEEA